MRFGNSVGAVLDRHAHAPDWFDFIELSIGERKLPVDDVDRDRLATVRDERDFGLVVHLPFAQPLATTVPELQRAHLDYLDRVLEAAADLGAEKAVAHASARSPTSDAERAVLPDAVADLTALGDDHGVEVCVENVGMLEHGFGLLEVADAVADAGGQLTLDVGHAFQEGGNDLVGAFLASHADLVSHLHVHDARTRGDSHVALGEGEVDWDRVGAGLTGFDGTATVEVFAEDRVYVERSAEVFRAALV